MEVLASETPREWLTESGVALAERVDSASEFAQAGAVVQREHFSLKNGDVDLHQVNANAIEGRSAVSRTVLGVWVSTP
jgi:hypothetical protein